jgi:hypothetical protein
VTWLRARHAPQPANTARGITAADLARCKMAGTVFSVLANVDQFYQ